MNFKKQKRKKPYGQTSGNNSVSCTDQNRKKAKETKHNITESCLKYNY